jgi:hypothetical protein
VKQKYVFLFFIFLFAFGLGSASVNYLWWSDTSVQIIEEETSSSKDAPSKKSSLDEEQLAKWLVDFMTRQIMFDHGVVLLEKDHSMTFTSRPSDVETPPPDRA